MNIFSALKPLNLLFVVVLSSCSIKVAVKPADNPVKSATDNTCHTLKLQNWATDYAEIVVVSSGSYFGKPDLGSTTPYAFVLLDDQKWKDTDLHYLNIEIDGEEDVEANLYTLEERKEGESAQIATFKTGQVVPLPVPLQDRYKKYIVTLDLKERKCVPDCRLKGELIIHKNGKEALLQEIKQYETNLTRYAKHQRKKLFDKRSTWRPERISVPKQTPCGKAVQSLTKAMNNSWITLTAYGTNVFKEGGFTTSANKKDVYMIVDSFADVQKVVDGSELYKSLFVEAFQKRENPINTGGIPYVGIDTSTILSIANELRMYQSRNEGLTAHHLLSAKLYFANEEERLSVLSEFNEEHLSDVISNYCQDGHDCILDEWKQSLASMGSEWALPFGGPILRRADVPNRPLDLSFAPTYNSEKLIQRRNKIFFKFK